MKYYEILYIVHPALEGGHLQDIVKSVNDLIEKNKGKIESNNDWGKKKLAYPIDKQKYGTYVLAQFSSKDGSGNTKVLKDLEHNSNILAYLLSNIEKNDIIESKETPAEETPAEEAPAEETPAEETPAEEAPAEEAPAEETPAEEAPDPKNNEEEK